MHLFWNLDILADSSISSLLYENDARRLRDDVGISSSSVKTKMKYSEDFHQWKIHLNEIGSSFGNSLCHVESRGAYIICTSGSVSGSERRNDTLL